MRVVEFFYFYLMPETAASRGASNLGGLQRTPSKRSGSGGGEGETKTTDEKQALLGRYLSNVEDLVEDLRDSSFGAILA